MIVNSAWKASKYGVKSGPYFSVFSPNAGKYGPQITPYLDTFHTVWSSIKEDKQQVFEHKKFYSKNLGWVREIVKLAIYSFL